MILIQHWIQGAQNISDYIIIIAPRNIKYTLYRSILDKTFHLHTWPFDLLLLIKFLAFLNTSDQNNTYNLWYSWMGSSICYSTQYYRIIPWYWPLVFFNLVFPWFSNPYALLLLWNCVHTYTLFFFYKTTCIRFFDKVNLHIQLKLPYNIIFLRPLFLLPILLYQCPITS